MTDVDDDTPRRVHLEKLSPAERAVRAAVIAVEALPADPRLTSVVTGLQDSRERLADWVDEHPDAVTEPVNIATTVSITPMGVEWGKLVAQCLALCLTHDLRPTDGPLHNLTTFEARKETAVRLAMWAHGNVS